MGRILAYLFLAAFALSACARRIDLMPAASGAGADLAAWCELDGEGRLVVRIVNQGNRMSIATTTLVQFGTRPPIVLPTHPVLPGQWVEVRLRPDDSCLQGGCRFTIQADARQEVAESDESNNLVTGRCR
ncbi:MAG: hypothetical protein V3T83_13570 [Acidobacteriota bacterium]